MLKLLMLFSIILATTSIPQESFMDSVNDAYEQYAIVLDESREIGDVTLVAGISKGKYSICAFLLNNGTNANHRICIYVDDKLTTFVPDGGVVAGYGLEIKADKAVKVYLKSDNDEILIYEGTTNNLISEVDGSTLKGNGSNTFPKNKKETDLLSRLRLFLFLFLGAAVVLAAVLIIMYKKAVGRFSGKKEEPLYNYEQQPEEQPEENNEFSVEEENKQAIMDRLFEEFRSGDITEEELNEKLKKLWWHNDD